MSVFYKQTDSVPFLTSWYWRCDFCLKLSSMSFEGYWEGRHLAVDDLNKHRNEQHDGFLWQNKSVTVASLEKARRKASSPKRTILRKKQIAVRVSPVKRRLLRKRR